MIMSKKSIFTIIIALLFNIQVFAADWISGDTIHIKL